MKTNTEAEFLAWAQARGIVLDPHYPQVAVLDFGSGVGDSRFWEIPSAPEQRPFFLASLLQNLGEWKSCYVWRHSGGWPGSDTVDPRRTNDRVEYEILRGIGLPMDTAQVVAFGYAESGSLLTLLFSTTVFGWSVNEDLYVVPGSGRYIIQTDHHGVVHVIFRNKEDVELWVRQMETQGFSLPEEAPDDTFKPLPWLKQ